MYGSDIFAPPRRGRDPQSGRGSLEYIVSNWLLSDELDRFFNQWMHIAVIIDEWNNLAVS